MTHTARISVMLVALLAVALRGARAGEGDQVVVIANGAMPESVELARLYMEARGIPADRLCALDLPRGETISRGFYETRMRDPLLRFLRDRGLIQQVRLGDDQAPPHHSGWRTIRSSLRYLVCLYGVPARIADSRYVLTRVANRMDMPLEHDGAAVDSELAAVLMDQVDLRGRLNNPLFDALRWEEVSEAPQRVLMATRLDGPDPAAVRRMIADAVATEPYGLQGRVFVDLVGRGEKSDSAGDYWLAEAAERLAREGYEMSIDRNPAVWPEPYPMEDAAFYLGWYTEQVSGPFLRPGFSLRPGAVAYHLHSFSALSVRTATEHWAGPLLARGACCTMGAVDEPYLGLTPRVHIFADRLCRGRNLGESAYMALPALSWQITVLGDPLYRPFRHSLDEQIAKLEADERPEVVWAYVRRINLLARSGRLNIAMAYTREVMASTHHPMLHEKLADLYAINDLAEDALAEYDKALDLAGTVESAVRVGVRYILLLKLRGQIERAAEVETRIRARWPGDPQLAALETVKP
jgi:uncharacterized protein (TIGR03790 family)